MLGYEPDEYFGQSIAHFHVDSPISSEVLNGVVRYRARAVVIDLTGVAEVDHAVLDTLLVLCRSCRGLGAEVVLSGISPAMAEKLVSMRVPVEEITAVAGLRDGIDLAKELILSPRLDPGPV